MLTDRNALLGKTLGTCTLERQIGQGGMGSVYLARQIRPRRQVAVKVLMPSLALDQRAQADFLARFRREADAVAALDHIHIMPVYEYGEQDQQAYLVMPYVTGGTLRQVLHARGTLPLSEALPIIEQITEALDYAHERGIIHRDIKPGNILFHADGRLLLTDFGLAKVLSETSEMPIITQEQSQDQAYQNSSSLSQDRAHRNSFSLSQGAMIGTPEYLSPEQALGREVDRRTDIYSLGILIFQILTGHVPFIGQSPVATAIMHAQNEPPAPSTFMPTISLAVEAVILRAIAKQPDQRYASAGEFARALRAASPDAEQASQSNSGGFRKSAPLSPQLLLNNDTQPEIEQVHMANEATDPWEPSLEQPSPPQAAQPTRPLHQARRKRHPLLLVSCSLLVLLVAGGIFAYLDWGRSAPGNAQISPVPTGPFTQPPVPVGARIYASTMLNSACQGGEGSWNQDGNAVVTCSSTGTRLSNTLHDKQYLASMFLNGTGTGDPFPRDYILQVNVRQTPDSQGEFGVLFRNQPEPQNGAYSFLLNPANNTWSAIAYNDQTGAATYLATRPGTVKITGFTGTITIDMVVQGATFTFYLDGQLQGSVTDTTYTTGTVGFSVNPNTDIYFSDLAVYDTPPGH